MALKGTLKDFAVADIFQLIGQQQKSGSLYVRTTEKEAHIVFDQGKVVLATFRKSDEDFLLGTMLLRAGVISAEQLARAIENQKVTLRSIGDILKSDGAINARTLSEFVNLQLKEILFRIFQWKEGFYEFVAEQIQYNRAIIKPQAAEAVLMDGFRMLDEWPSVLERIGTLEAVFRPLEAPAGSEATLETTDEDVEPSFDLTDDESDGADKVKERGLSEEDRKVLAMLDGHRSLQEVIYTSRLGTFEASRVVAELLSRGRVAKVDQLAQTRIDTHLLRTRSKGTKEWLESSVRLLLFVFALALVLPILAFGIRSDWSARYALPEKAPGGLLEERASFDELARAMERNRLGESISVQYVEHGRFPMTLEGIAPGDFASHWNYTPFSDHYVLTEKRLAP